MLAWLRRKAESVFGAPRSGRWKSWREAHIRRQPFCQACKATDDLEVHHIIPVHAGGPELAPPEGLITLCRPCHLCVGHACDWKAWRPEVRKICEVIRAAEVKR